MSEIEQPPVEPNLAIKDIILTDTEIASRFETDDYQTLLDSLLDLQKRYWEGIKDSDGFVLVSINQLIKIAGHVPNYAKMNLNEERLDDALSAIVPTEDFGFRDCLKRCIEKEKERQNLTEKEVI